MKKSPRRSRAPLKISASAVTTVAMVVRGLLFGTTGLGATLPVPCAAGSCNANSTPGFKTAPGGFVTAGTATATQTGNTLTVNQSTNQAILNWSSFNVSADGKVVFNQPNAASIALNKIYQNNPSSIFGQLTANGQIYLINPNGFVFGSSAKVNVAGLVASSLGLYNGDSELAAGLLSPLTDSTPHPALASDGRVYVTDSSGNLVLDSQGNPQPVQVVVQSGAQITATDGGRLMLAGQNVTNAGTLSSPDGQTILAAGQSVYLAASGDASLRGLLVEVTGNGVATNAAGGVVSAPRGNVSLIGLAVNQQGRISATTSVSYNGSVILEAATGGAASGGGASCQAGEKICATQGGTLTLGSSSEIDVLPEYSSTATAAVAQTQTQSSIQLTGQKVFIEGGQITAPGGNLTVLAATNPDGGLSTYDANAELRVASGANINLSGSDATLPMSSNLVSIQLNSNELEDDPLQRTGALKGETVIVDVRKGKPGIISDASWQAALQGIEENVAQRTSAGGTASFKSEGDVVVGSGAKINVSGGNWTYTSGIVQDSQLIGANGKTYDVSTADPSLSYTGVLNPTFKQTYNGFGVQITSPTPGESRYETGYVEGFSAGSITFAAPAMSLQGTLLGTAVNGPYQRSAATIPSESLIGYLSSSLDGGSGMATGGTLIIGDSSPVAGVGGTLLGAYFAPAVTFSTSTTPIVVAEGAALPVGTLQLPVSYITSGGFATTQIYSDSTVTVPAGLPLNLGAGGSLQVVAPRINVNSDITALGGTIDLQSAQSAYYASAGLPRPGIDIGDGVTLNVSGQWTNDSTLARSTSITSTYQNGGTIDLTLADPTSATTYSVYSTGGALMLGNNVTLEANGGAWVQATNTVVGGAGGTIALNASPYQSALQVGTNVSVEGFGVKGAAGGSFSLLAPRIEVVQGNGSWAAAQGIDDLLAPGEAFKVGAGLFSRDGFSQVTLEATAPVLASAVNGDLLTIDAGTVINAQAETLALTSSYVTRQSGGTVQGFTQVETLPEAQRNPYTLKLYVLPAGTDPTTTNGGEGNLDIQAGVSITTDPRSTIALETQGSILLDGTLRAPDGTITATIDNPTISDYGYLASQGIVLGSQAVLDVSGTVVSTPNSLNLALGSVLPGGAITLSTMRGDIVADAGSQINIGGASSVLSVQAISGSGGYTSETVGSAGGSLTIVSGESVSLLGKLSATAGANGSGALQAGSLAVELDPTRTASGLPTTGTGFQSFPSLSPTIELAGSSTGSPSAPYGNSAVLGITQLEQSGIDALTLQAFDGTITIDSSTALTLGREITLNAPNIAVAYGTAASLNAPYVEFTNSNVNATGSKTALGGTGSLSVNADQIVLSGYTALQGVGYAKLSSSGDVELEPLAVTNLSGALAVDGNLTINASRIYPATETTFTISDAASGGTVTIGQTTASAGTPLSAAGTLEIDATNIVSGGTILAPFGKIRLSATGTLSLLSGSVTSVSGDSTVIPYGATSVSGAEWVYDSGANGVVVSGTPTRQVTLSGGSVSFASGAKIDLSGGGDLSAYEWVPGTGGSQDVLSQANAAASNLYAIVPASKGSYAAYDVQEFSNSNVHTGETIYLSSGSGVPAGYYVLLPARYALLPNAYLVQAETSFTSTTPGVIGALSDGTKVVAGYFSFGDTGLKTSSGYVGFAVRSGTYSQTLAEYDVSYASSYFSSKAAAAGATSVVLPADAGALLIEPTNSLIANGTVNSAAGTNGTSATIEISASDLTVTGSGSAAVNGGVSISAAVLQSWNPGDLLLGGILSSDGSTIDVVANTVTIGKGAQLSAGQILAVANTGIDVQSGATLASTSGASGKALAQLPSSQSYNLTSGAALLAVSDSGLPVAVRAGTSSSNATIDIETGATLSTRGAVALDSPGTVTIAGNITAPGASWSLASSSIAFVSSLSSSGDSLQISPSVLAEMQAAGAVALTSAGAVDLQTAVNLGATSASSSLALSSLTITAASLDNNCAGCASVFGAKTLTLNGIGTNTTPTSTNGGTLILAANTLNLGGSGDLLIDGNAQTTMNASGAVVGQGSATSTVSTLAFGGNVSIAAAELTAASQSATEIVVPNGALTISQNGSAAKPSSLTGSLGGQLTLAASSIQDSGSIIVPGGGVSLASSSDLTLTSGAVINTAGITVTAGNVTEGAAGGTVSILAGGNLTLASGSTISVAGAGSAPAGSLSVSGDGEVTIDGALTGAGGTNATGGSFSLYAGTLVDGLSSALVKNLTDGGFANQLNIRAQTGDLTLASGDSLTANQINLTADSGNVDVYGSLTATAGSQSGFIGLYGGKNVTLESGGALTANGISSTGHGGEIEISSTCAGCSVNLDSNSTIRTSGGSLGGRLVIEAPESTTDYVAINVGTTGLGANVSGVGQVLLVPVLVDDTVTSGNVSTALPADVGNMAAYLAANSSNIENRLAPGVKNVAVEGGVEIQDTSASDTLILPGIDLGQYSSAGQVVNLTVRAAGGLTIAGNIIDGVTGGSLNGIVGGTVYTSGDSGTLRFVAGADLTSANTLATAAVASGGGADLTIGQGRTGRFVTTGTGDINLVASRDVVFTAGSSVYTTGTVASSATVAITTSSSGTLNFFTDGGNVVVNAGRDVQGNTFTSTSDDLTPSYWELRGTSPGSSSTLGTWSTNLSSFDRHPWDVATFAGGDLTVTAGRDVYEVSAATADGLEVSTSSSGATVQTHFASGGLNVSAGRDVTTGLYFVANGVGTLTAGRSFGTTASTTETSTIPVGSLFFVQDSQISLWAASDITVAGVLNPTVEDEPLQSTAQPTFWTYGADSAFNAQSDSGDVTLTRATGDATWMSELLGSWYKRNSTLFTVNVVTPTLGLTSLTRDVNIDVPSTLYPSGSGQLSLFAGRDVIGSSTSLVMSDAPDSVLSTASAVLTGAGASGELAPTQDATKYNFYADLHAADSTPASIVAGRDIVDMNVSVPKAAQIVAGRDIVALQYQGQNLNTGDLTLIYAGRDFINPTTFNATGNAPTSTGGVQLGGPGSLDILAGRNIDLGFSSGVTTVGDLANANLSTATGASITMMAGLGQNPDYSAFFTQIIEPSATYQAQLVTYVESLTGQSNLTVAQAETAFTGFTSDEQRALVDSVFFNELDLSGKAANASPSAGYTRGYAAIDALFPGSRTSSSAYSGNLNLVYSQIYTESGGDISLLVPGGAIDVGLAVAPAGVSPKAAGQLGIVAEGAGNVDIYSLGDVNVNASRVFTLGGGNILIWSDEGSIDAGKGSKTSLSVPPPTYTIDPISGQVKTTFGSAVAGSGIRTIQTSPSEPAGNVDLVAPAGTVNAGEAGIGAAGSINISALVVLNVANINFGGTATGVPPVVSGITASLASAATAASSATTSVTSTLDNSSLSKEAVTPLAQSAISWLDVFVTGLGEENCKSDDVECLKRQKQ